MNGNKENNVFKDGIGVKGLRFKLYGNNYGNHGKHYGNLYGNYHDNHGNHGFLRYLSYPESCGWVKWVCGRAGQVNKGTP